MISLTREIRFSLISDSDSSVSNSWGGWPSATQIAPWLVFRCRLEGEIDPTSGYLCNVKTIDDAIRERVILPACEMVNQEGGDLTCESILRRSCRQLEQIADVFPANCRLSQLQICPTPTLKYTLKTREDAMTQTTQQMIQLTQQFEFSASHRLHNSELSDEENRQLFGKCNNPHGHGHNYVVAVTIEGNINANTGVLVNLEQFERAVKEHVIDRMDHHYLNVELDEFRELNPSVENIALVIWGLLKEPIAGLDGDAKLKCVRVYETPKTWAECNG